jgi:hypothetical protein
MLAGVLFAWTEDHSVRGGVTPGGDGSLTGLGLRVRLVDMPQQRKSDGILQYSKICFEVGTHILRPSAIYYSSPSSGDNANNSTHCGLAR